MRYNIFIITVVAFTSCNVKEHNSNKIISKEIDTLTDNESRYLFIKFNLYKDRFGKIGFKTIDNSYKNPVDRYLTIVWNANPKDTIDNGKMEMKDIIDTATFKEVETNGIYYKDKNHFYVYNEMMDGGTFAVAEDIDAKTFTVLNEYYAKDKLHCYYKDEIIKDADLKTFEPVSNIDSSGLYAKDKNHYYWFGEIIKPEDYQSHHLK